MLRFVLHVRFSMCLRLSFQEACCVAFARSMSRFIYLVPSAPWVAFTAHLPRTGLRVSEYMQATEQIQIEMAPVCVALHVKRHQMRFIGHCDDNIDLGLTTPDLDLPIFDAAVYVPPSRLPPVDRGRIDSLCAFAPC